MMDTLSQVDLYPKCSKVGKYKLFIYELGLPVNLGLYLRVGNV